MHKDFYSARKLVYDPCGFDLENPQPDEESQAYGACTFTLNGKVILFRAAKITPTKAGQFVTVWKRNDQGITAPYESSDAFDFMVISTVDGVQMGQFVFPKVVLVEQGIVTRANKAGKRGFRVYPPWDLPGNKQAEKTQNWQSRYFLRVQAGGTADSDLAKKLFGFGENGKIMNTGY